MHCHDVMRCLSDQLNGVMPMIFQTSHIEDDSKRFLRLKLDGVPRLIKLTNSKTSEVIASWSLFLFSNNWDQRSTSILRQTATTTQAPTDSSTEAVAADLGASLVFCLLFGKELETPAFSLSGELLSSHDISSEATRTFMETEGFRQSSSICVGNLLCGHGDHKENWTFLSELSSRRPLAWVLDACRVWMIGLVVETLIYHWGFLVQQVMLFLKIGEGFYGWGSGCSGLAPCQR